MDVARFEQVLRAVQPHTGFLNFHVMGEPCLSPDLGRFLALSHAAGLKVNLTTNGTRLKQVGDVLLNAPGLRQVNLSLSSFEANEMTQPLEDYLRAVTGFVNEASARTGIICAIRLWNMDTCDLKGDNRFNGEILRFLESHLGLAQGALAAGLKDSFSVKMKERVFLKMAEKFEWPDLDKSGDNCELFCHGLRDQVGVLVDGTVVPCCLDNEGTIALGNIFETPLQDILDGKRARNLFDGFSRRRAVEPLCRKCTYATRY